MSDKPNKRWFEPASLLVAVGSLVVGVAGVVVPIYLHRQDSEPRAPATPDRTQVATAEPTSSATASETPTPAHPTTSRPGRGGANSTSTGSATTATTVTAPVSYPYTQSYNLSLPCTMSEDCWAGGRITTVLTSVTVHGEGRVDVHIRFTSAWDDPMVIVFNPWAALRDGSGNEEHAWANDGGAGHISIPARASVNYTIGFGGLNPPAGTTCTFKLRIQQSGEYTMDYDNVTVACR